MRLAEFQEHIRTRYHETDAARGAAGTFLWFAEEFGELAEAIAMHLRGDGDHAHLEEEFADVMAWLATLANITNVDLERAIDRKYFRNGGPEGTK